MGLRQTRVVFFVLLSIYFIQFTLALPRDNSFLQAHNPMDLNAESEAQTKDSTNKITKEEIIIPGRIWCQYEEASEATVCQEHCLPKGYSYGICVSNTCSCI